MATTNPGALRTDGRNAGLSEPALRLLNRAGLAIRHGDFDAAAQALDGAIALAPSHPEVRRMRGVLLSRSGRHEPAIATLRALSNERPNDAVVLNDLASALFAARDVDAAFATWQRACELAPNLASAWFNFGKNLKSEGDIERAIPLLERSIAIDPGVPSWHVILGDALTYAGRLDDAVARYRAALALRPEFGAAWWGLANTKTVRLGPADVERLTAIVMAEDIADDERIPAGFALGKACEDDARYADAFAAYRDANARMRARTPWNAADFSRQIDAIVDPRHLATARAETAGLGREVIFIVSLPRSGSTLTEQILAAHPDVEGASELPALGRIISEESERRRREFPDWIADATSADWERLGRDYLARTARWRKRRPRFTDKMPNNWPFVGAVLAMLPGARVINCRRDPLETGWSCFKQLFAVGQKFSYDLGDIGAMWRDYDRTMRFWHERAPEHVRDQVYEALLAEPEAQTRALLAFCGLAFDPACLRFHEAERTVRTASAAQVREPLRRDTARAVRYGALLRPLRTSLGI